MKLRACVRVTVLWCVLSVVVVRRRPSSSLRETAAVEPHAPRAVLGRPSHSQLRLLAEAAEAVPVMIHARVGGK